MGAKKDENSGTPVSPNTVRAFCNDGKESLHRCSTQEEEPVPRSADKRFTTHDEEQRPRSSQNQRCKRDQLKTALRSLLAETGGSTKDPGVISAIDDLSNLNPVAKNAFRSPMFCGSFVALTSPNFPGRVKPGPEKLIGVKYTLGRLSFNIFQPSKLVCTLRSVRNPVVAHNSIKKDGLETFSYSLILDITIHTSKGDLPAILINEGYCSESKEENNRVMVTFTGGTLMPCDEVKNDISKTKLWYSTFQGAYKKAAEERTYAGRVFQFLVNFLLGLTLPDDDSSSLSFHFEMKRPPTGHFEVLYLDEDLRITRGNRGTLVVVERCRKIGEVKSETPLAESIGCRLR